MAAPELIDRLVEKEEQHRLLLGMNQDFARLRRDPDAWAAFQAEIEAWDTASAPIDAEPGDAS